MAAVGLGRDFYARAAIDCAPSFLGKALVHETPGGRVAGIISEVEAYPAYTDDVHHGNRRTTRTEVMWGPPGHAYVYVVYGVCASGSTRDDWPKPASLVCFPPWRTAL